MNLVNLIKAMIHLPSLHKIQKSQRQFLLRRIRRKRRINPVRRRRKRSKRVKVSLVMILTHLIVLTQKVRRRRRKRIKRNSLSKKLVVQILFLKQQDKLMTNKLLRNKKIYLTFQESQATQQHSKLKITMLVAVLLTLWVLTHSHQLILLTRFKITKTQTYLET